jgi:rare lipoprotein A
MSFYGTARQAAARGAFASKLAARVTCAMLAVVIFSVADAARAVTHPGAARNTTTGKYLGVPAATKKTTHLFSGLRCSTSSFIAETPGCEPPTMNAAGRVPAGEVFVGSASTYNPNDPADRESGGAQTATGELYDEESWTAAIRTDLRWHFGGVRFGRNYQPVFALVEGAGKRVIVRINDVGPLKPGRIIDLNARTMRHLDPTMQIGVIHDVKVTPLFGEDVAVGPVATGRTVLAGDVEWLFSAPHLPRNLDDQSQFGPLLLLR